MMSSHGDKGALQVAMVKRTTGSQYQVTMTGTELALIRSALSEAERISRFAIEVLDEADRSPDGKSSEKRALRQKIDALAMREASLRSLRKTMSEVDGGGKPASSRLAAVDDLRSDARPPVPPPRRNPDA